MPLRSNLESLAQVYGKRGTLAATMHDATPWANMVQHPIQICRPAHAHMQWAWGSQAGWLYYMFGCHPLNKPLVMSRPPPKPSLTNYVANIGGYRVVSCGAMHGQRLCPRGCTLQCVHTCSCLWYLVPRALAKQVSRPGPSSLTASLKQVLGMSWCLLSHQPEEVSCHTHVVDHAVL